MSFIFVSISNVIRLPGLGVVTSASGMYMALQISPDWRGELFAQVRKLCWRQHIKWIWIWKIHQQHEENALRRNVTTPETGTLYRILSIQREPQMLPSSLVSSLCKTFTRSFLQTMEFLCGGNYMCIEILPVNDIL